MVALFVSAVKHYFAIIGWTVGVWLTVSISFSISFPGVIHHLRGAPPGSTAHLSFLEWLVLSGPAWAGILALVLGLLGLLPGTDPKDGEDNQS